MFLGFWSWVLVALIIGAIFYAEKLPGLKDGAEGVAKKVHDKLQKFSKAYEERMMERIEQRDKKIFDAKRDAAALEAEEAAKKEAVEVIKEESDKPQE